MVDVRLLGLPDCRRYQKMLTAVIHEAEKLGIQLNIEEISDYETLMRFNPISLPRLYIQGELIASQNPPKPLKIVQALQKVKSM